MESVSDATASASGAERKKAIVIDCIMRADPHGTHEPRTVQDDGLPDRASTAALWEHTHTTRQGQYEPGDYGAHRILA